MKRIRELYDKEDESVDVPLVFATDGVPTWHQRGELANPPSILKSPTKYRHDDPAWENPNTQDCVAMSCDQGVGIEIPGFGASQWLPYNYGNETGRLIRCRKVVSNMKDAQGYPFDIRRMIGSPYVMYNRLKSKPFTTQVHINTDPFDSEFSLWYLIVDLIQLPKLAEQMLKFATIRSHKISRSYREASSAYLGAQFGLLPTIQDVKDFMSLVTKWGSTYSKLSKKLNRLHVHHETPRGGVVVEQAYSVSRQYRWVELGATVDVNVHCDVFVTKLIQATKFFFVCPELHGILNRLKQLVDGLGLLDPAAAWDLVPFSFLVDWIVNVGRYLHRNMKPRLFPADMVIPDWSESLGRRFLYRGFASYPSIDPANAVPVLVKDQSVMNGGGIQYARVCQYPHKLEVDKSGLTVAKSILNIKRAIIGTALVSQHLTGIAARAGREVDGDSPNLPVIVTHKRTRRRPTKR